MRCAQKGSRHCSTGRVLPWLIMMSKGKIIGAAIAAASALETVVAVSGSTRTNPDQMIMKVAATKPAVTIAPMFLLIANLLVDCRGEVSLRKQPDIPIHRRVSCVHWNKTAWCRDRSKGGGAQMGAVDCIWCPKVQWLDAEPIGNEEKKPAKASDAIADICRRGD
jgi:hypothetical protein